jgi:hypothetical protein
LTFLKNGTLNDPGKSGFAFTDLPEVPMRFAVYYQEITPPSCGIVNASWGSADEAAAAQKAATEAFEGARSRGLDEKGLPAGKWCLTAEESKTIMEPIHACFSLFANKDDVIEDTELSRLAVALQCGDDEDELFHGIFGLPSTQRKISKTDFVRWARGMMDRKLWDMAETKLKKEKTVVSASGEDKLKQVKDKMKTAFEKGDVNGDVCVLRGEA